MKPVDLMGYFNDQKETFIKIMKELVSFETYSGEIKNIKCFLDYLENLFSEFNPEKSRIRTANGDILKLSLFSKQKDYIVFLAHADTVKVADHPIPVKIENGRFYGNGCFDMKSAIVLFYFTLKAIHRFDLKCDMQIKLIFTPDEETGSDASKPFLLKECKNAISVILPEPCCENGGVKTRRKGITWMKAKLIGKASHSGTEPEKGKDANRALVELINKIDKNCCDYPDVSFNPGIICGGIATNVVSPVSFMEGEFRSYSNISLDKLIKDVKKINNIEGIDVEMFFQIKQPALEFTPENKKIYEKAKQIARLLDYDLPSCSSGGGSDGATLSSEGVPVIDGIGIRGGGAHSKKEYIEISDFPFRATLITKLYQEIK